jgi:hypothetical protein
MSLFQAAITQVDTETVSKTLLLNSKKVRRAFQNSSGTTTFYYADTEDRRNPATKYIYDGTLAAFRALIDETDVQTFVYWDVTDQGAKRETPEAISMEFRVDNIIRADNNSDGTSCTLYFAEGSFEIKRYTLPHTIAQLDSSASGSGNLSAH